MNRFRIVCALQVILLASSLTSFSEHAQGITEENDLSSPDGVVQELYDLVTFEAGETPDWDRVRSLFLDQAIVVLRTSRDNTTVFSLEGFVEDFVKFIERAHVRESGFVEKIIRMKPMVFGDMAHVLVLYEASIPGSSKPPQQGVDSFQLIRKSERWWIVAITNEIPTTDRPVPVALQE